MSLVRIGASPSTVEIVVVDDGSKVPVKPPLPWVRVVRTPGIERSRARNLGAVAASGRFLLFLDDDMEVLPGWIDAHLAKHQEGPDPLLVVGSVQLPDEWLNTPYGRFRSELEVSGLPAAGPASPSVCTAQNMSMERRCFLGAGGFDPKISSAEDQDLASRVMKTGINVYYEPSARAIHHDSNRDMVSYGRRHEWGARAMAPFLRRYPTRPENLVRTDLAVPWVRLPPRRWPGRMVRVAMAYSPVLWAIEAGVSALERLPFSDGARFRFYRLLLGLRLLRGFRQGLATVRAAPPLPGSSGRSPSWCRHLAGP